MKAVGYMCSARIVSSSESRDSKSAGWKGALEETRRDMKSAKIDSGRMVS